MADRGKPGAMAGASTGVEVDPVTGQPTTGHVWDGIRELNRPLPRWWLWTFYATIAWAAVYVVLYPAIPLLRGATSGILGYSTRSEVAATIDQAAGAQAARRDRVASLSLAEIAGDAELMRFAVQGGRSAFLVNCVQCHGSGAAGSPGYANLNDDDWLWGGTAEDIRRTIAFGVRSGHPEARDSLMPAFGADGILTPDQVLSVADYVLSLSGSGRDDGAAAAGAQLYVDYCAACHGETGEGKREFGAPQLNDAIWLYGGDRTAVVAQITRPRHGVMPAWTERLDGSIVKQLALFVHSLGGGEVDGAP